MQPEVDEEEQWCNEHWAEARVGNGIEATVLCVQYALADELFYRTAFRIKNGYAPPEDLEEIPPVEQPHNIHVNETLHEFSPICCYLEEQNQFQEVVQIVRGEKEPPEWITDENTTSATG